MTEKMAIVPGKLDQDNLVNFAHRTSLTGKKLIHKTKAPKRRTTE